MRLRKRTNKRMCLLLLLATTTTLVVVIVNPGHSAEFFHLSLYSTRAAKLTEDGSPVISERDGNSFRNGSTASIALEKRQTASSKRRKMTKSEANLLSSAHRQATRYRWQVNASHRHRAEVHHVVFEKVHKAASSTVQNVLFRFSLSRQLNIMLPYPTHVLSPLNGAHYREIKLLTHPQSPPFLFDVLCNHMTFDRATVQPLFPADTKYMAILREPFQQLRSAFYYWTLQVPKSYLTKAPSFEHFLQNRPLYEPASPEESRTNNYMSIDMGLKVEHISNSSCISAFLRQTERDFDLVLIAERFDESMVLMKRLFRWTMKDIVYQKINAGRKQTETSVKPDPKVLKQFRRFQRFDVALYDHYTKVFDKRVADQGADFEKEVKVYVQVLRVVSEFCGNQTPPSKILVVKSSPWNKEFILQRAECSILQEREVPLNNWLRKMQLARLAPMIFSESSLYV